MPRLYELTNEYEDILQDVELLDGELPPDLAKRFDEIKDAIDVKVDRCQCVRAELAEDAAVWKARAEKFQAEADRLTARAKKAEKGAAFLQRYILQAMSTLGVDELVTERYKLKRVAYPGSVSIFDASLMPPAYWNHPTPNLANIRRDLMKGDSVPGAELQCGERLSVT